MPDFGIFRGFNDKLFGDKLYAGQLPTQLGIIGSQEVFDIDLDAQAFFDRVDAATGVPNSLSATEKTAIDTLVKQMKIDGIWTKMKAIYPMVGASAAACAQNLKSSSFTGSFSSGWTFSSTGVLSGNSSFMNTNIKPNDMAQNSLHFGFYNTGINAAYKMGVYATSPVFSGAYLRGVNATNDNLVNGADDSALFQRETGMVVANRIDGINKMVFNNGVKSSRASLSLSPINFNFYLNGVSANGNSSNALSGSNFSFCTIGDGLTDQNGLDYYTAVQAFNTTLSRQV
jgi:hypothetical protein